MSLNTALRILIEEYPKAMEQPFKDNEVAKFIRNDIPEYINEIIDSNDRFKVEGSPGKGNWAGVPWVAVLDRFITETVQDGYYAVYLVKEDFSGIYLSLNQGVTTVQKQYGSAAKEALEIRAKDYAARIGKIPERMSTGAIDLACTAKSKLGPLYEVGSVLSFYYSADNLPDDEELARNLESVLSLYYLLSIKEAQLYTDNELEDDESGLEFENLKKIRIHKRIERNSKLSKKVKKLKGCTCEACGFNFAEMYGEIGEGFIEAHHLKPLHTLTGEKIALDPVKDFSVLCSNCHKMIHRSEFVSEVNEFRDKYVKSQS
jgi:5-methylcytosine-specific restriction protein A